MSRLVIRRKTNGRLQRTGKGFKQRHQCACATMLLVALLCASSSIVWIGGDFSGRALIENIAMLVNFFTRGLLPETLVEILDRMTHNDLPISTSKTTSHSKEVILGQIYERKPGHSKLNLNPVEGTEENPQEYQVPVEISVRETDVSSGKSVVGSTKSLRRSWSQHFDTSTVPLAYLRTRAVLNQHPLRRLSPGLLETLPMDEVMVYLSNKTQCLGRPIFTSMANVRGSDLYWQM